MVLSGDFVEIFAPVEDAQKNKNVFSIDSIREDLLSNTSSERQMNQKSKQFIRSVTNFRNDTVIGEKSAGIRNLMKSDYSVPITCVCSSTAYACCCDKNSVVGNQR